MEIDPTQFFAGVGMIVTFASGFGLMMRKLGRMEQKFDIIWAWYLELQRHAVRGGRRHTDLPRASIDE